VSADQPGGCPSGRAGAAAAASSGGPAPAGTLDFLSGHWNVVRQIADSLSGRGGTFVGTASFTPAAGTVTYAEQGELAFGEHRGPASRSLIYRGRADGAADVYFADGREFFCLDLTRGDCQAEHLCRADRYQVRVTRTGDDSFTETWRVVGPAKDYEMTTRYRRTGGRQ
jgi:hypothetical protein